MMLAHKSSATPPLVATPVAKNPNQSPLQNLLGPARFRSLEQVASSILYSFSVLRRPGVDAREGESRRDPLPVVLLTSRLEVSMLDATEH